MRDNTVEGNPAIVDKKEIKAALTNIKKGLKKEEVRMRFIEKLSKVIKHVLYMSRKPLITGVEARLKRIKKMLLGQVMAKK
jgi:hypothetical protein